MQMNTDQLDNKMTELLARVKLENPDIICATEIIPKNPKNTIYKEAYEIPGYEMHDNIDKYGKVPNLRGSIIYIKRGLTWKAVEYGLFEESLFIEVKLKGGDNLLCCSLYRRGETSAENNNQLLSSLKQVANKKYSHAVLMGDINLRHIIWDVDEEDGTVIGYCSNTDPKIFENRFLECLRDCLFFQHITEPTRQRGSDTPTTLDLLMTNEENLIKNLQYQSPLGKSDHSVLVFEIVCEEELPPPVIKSMFNKGDYEKFNKLMAEVNWEEELGKMEGDVEGQWKLFKSKYAEAEKVCVPTKKIFINGQENKKLSTRYDRATVLKMKKKNKIWGRIRKNLADEEERLQYNKLRNQIRRLTRKSKKLIEKNIAQKAKSNPKAFYKYAQSKLKSRSSIPDLIKPGTEKNPVYITQDQDKAEAYLEYFGSVFTEESYSDELPDFPERDYMSVLSTINITVDTVLEKLKKLKKNKSPGPDKIHPRVLHEIAGNISLPLSIIFKTSLQTMSLPKEWKHANITAIFKKGKKTSPSNYRPVSLTCIICKILESIIRDAIIKHMNDNNMFSPKQFGFLSKRSTVLQLIRVLDIWSEILEQGGSIDAIYMDFMKAFDKVPHRRLVYKIDKYGIKGNILGWIKDFLSERTQCVVLNNSISSQGKVTSGIPQGSVLGPILFVLYINDLPEVVDKLSFVFLFADDTKIFRKISSAADVEVLQSDINKLVEWSDKWLLRFHPDKCIAMSLGKDVVDTDRKYYMNDTVLKESCCEKDIGVHVDNKLDFKKHITTCVNKANRILAMIFKTFDYMDEFIFKQLFKSLVRPHLEYAAPVWSPHNENLKKLIENVQKRATKRIPGFSDLSYPERLRRLNMPTLAYRRLRGDMIHVFKLQKGFFDPTLPEIFTQNKRSSKGHDQKIVTKRGTKDIRKYNFSVRAIEMWNSLSQECVDAESILQFEKALDDHWKHQEVLYDNFKADIKYLTHPKYADFNCSRR